MLALPPTVNKLAMLGKVAGWTASIVDASQRWPFRRDGVVCYVRYG
jgi:hypothetical protein